MVKTTPGEQMYLHGFYIREKPGHLHRPGLVVRPREGVGDFNKIGKFLSLENLIFTNIHKTTSVDALATFYWRLD